MTEPPLSGVPPTWTQPPHGSHAPRPGPTATCRAAVHMHSTYSHDGVDSLEALREQSLTRGIRWLALTDHAEDFDDDAFAVYREQCATLSDDRLHIVPGLEFRLPRMRGVHMLALGVTHLFAPSSADDFFAHARADGAFTILAHPVLCRYAPSDVIAAHVDGIEVWNARYNSSVLPDPRAIELLQSLRTARPELVATIGHDQHDGHDDAATNLLLTTSHDSLLDALRAGRFVNAGRTMSFDSHADLAPAVMQSLKRRRAMLDGLLGVRSRFHRIARRYGW